MPVTPPPPGPGPLHGSDPTSGIVAVQVDRDGPALIWRRTPDGVVLERHSWRPWTYAHDLQDLAHLGADLSLDDPRALYHAERLPGPASGLPYLLSARNSLHLDRELQRGWTLRGAPGPPPRADVQRYLTLSPVHQYLTVTGRTFYRNLPFSALRRALLHVQTSGPDPQQGRVLVIGLHLQGADTARHPHRGRTLLITAEHAEQERAALERLEQLIASTDPDLIEGELLYSTDLPFLQARARHHGLRLNFGRPGGRPGLWSSPESSQPWQWACAGRELSDHQTLWRRQGATLPPRPRQHPQGLEDARRETLSHLSRAAAHSADAHRPSYQLARWAPRPYGRLGQDLAHTIVRPVLLRAYLRAGQGLAELRPLHGEPGAEDPTPRPEHQERSDPLGVLPGLLLDLERERHSHPDRELAARLLTRAILNAYGPPPGRHQARPDTPPCRCVNAEPASD